MTESCFITFPTTYFAIRAESILKSQPYSFKMVPVPRSISSSCGTALRCRCEDLDAVKSLLQEHDMELEGLYRLEEMGLKTPATTRLDQNPGEIRYD